MAIMMPCIYTDGGGWTVLNSSVKYMKKNGYLSIRINASGLTSGAWNTLGTMPTGYRPENADYYLISNGGTGAYTCLVSVANSNGELQVKPLNGTGAYGLIIYPLAD